MAVAIAANLRNAFLESPSRLICDADITDTNEHKKKNNPRLVMEKFLGAKTNDFLRNEFPVLGFGLVASLHCIAGLDKYLKFLPRSVGKFLDQHSLSVTKVTKAINFLFKGIECLSVGRSVEGALKLILPIFFFKSKLENFFALTGMVSGLTMMEASQIPKTNLMPNNNDLLGNLKNNLHATTAMYQEIFGGKNLDYNHLFFAGGNVKLIGSVLGTIFERNDFLRKTFSVIRNGGSMIADVSKFFQKDINWKISGSLYPLASIFDMIQNLINNLDERRIFAHLSFAANALANFFYLNITKARTDGTYKV